MVGQLEPVPVQATSCEWRPPFQLTQDPGHAHERVPSVRYPRGRKRAGYGDELIEWLARDLTARFGRGFGQSNLWQIRAFYLAYPNILQATPGELSAGEAPDSAGGACRI